MTLPGMPEPPPKRKKSRRGYNAPAKPMFDAEGRVLDSERGFLERLQRGHMTEEVIADALRSEGLDVAIAELSTDLDPDDQADIIVGGRIILEVKGRKLRFTGYWDYPYKTILLGSADRWDRRRTKPDAFVVVSEVTGAAIAFWTDSPMMDRVQRETHYDKYRNKEEVSLAVGRAGWHRWYAFVNQLKEMTGVETGT